MKHELVRWAIWFNVALVYGTIATIMLVPQRRRARDRITESEWHALERKLAVARLKDELAPKVRWWKVKRWLRRIAGRA